MQSNQLQKTPIMKGMGADAKGREKGSFFFVFFLGGEQELEDQGKRGRFGGRDGAASSSCSSS